MTTPCDQCKSIGLPILLARYAVVPSTVQQSLPGWTSGDKVKSVALGGDYKYALRTLRAGYVYLFYGKGQRGSNYWECYSVGEDGSMILQPSTAMAQPQATPVLLCTRNGHTNTNVYFIVIPEPQKCGPVWIAFSEHKWSEDTLARYKADTALRDKRMQTIQPPAMAGGAKHTHGQIADAAVLKEIIEFAPREPTLAALPHGGNAAVVSNADGSYITGALTKQSTRYPWHFKDDVAQPVVDRMIARGKTPDPNDKDAKPHVLALWDAVGITHELNGFRNEAAGCIAKYGNERELEITAMNAIEGVKKALETKREDQTRDYLQSERERRAMGYDPALVQGRRARALKAPDSPLKTAELRHCELMDYIGTKGLWYAFEFDLSRIQMDTDPARRMAAYDQFKARVDAHVAALPQQEREILEESRGGAARDWQKYEKKLQPGAQAAFKKKYDTFLGAADKIIDARTVELIKWLEAPLLMSTLEDYHDRNVSDGVAFEDVVGDAIFGIASSKSGAMKIEEWVKQAKASVKTNLLWRAIALNQQDGVAEVDTALQAAYGSPTTLSEAAWGNVGAQVKWNKLADLYKKAVSLANANVKQGVNPVQTRGLDKVLITLGDAAFKPVAKVVDTVNEKLLQTLFLLRSGVDLNASLALVAAQAKHEGVSRARLIQRINTSKAFVQADVSTERKLLNQRWAALKSSADVPDARTGALSGVKETRLAVIVAILEGVNLWKISKSVSNDPKIQFQLRAAQMATAAACLDIAASAIKGASALKDVAMSYQVLKVSGGVLSGGASFVGSYLDWGERQEQRAKANYAVARLYAFRSVSQFLSGSLTILIGVSYTAPLLKQLSQRFAASFILRAGSSVAGWALGARAALMLGGIWVSVATLAISAAIWYFSDDALQDWCDQSAFGKVPQAKRFADATAQMKLLGSALAEVL
jgi:hypothetical protein